MQLNKYLYVSVRVRVCACECGQLFVHGCVRVYVQEHVVRERERKSHCTSEADDIKF